MGNASVKSLAFAVFLLASFFPPDESMGTLYQRSQDCFESGDLQGAIAALDELLEHPGIKDVSRIPVLIKVAQYRGAFGFPDQALKDLDAAEQILESGKVKQFQTEDLCFVSSERVVSYLILGLHDHAERSLKAMDRRLESLRRLPEPVFDNVVISNDFAHALFLKSVAEHDELDEWVGERLNNKELYDKFPDRALQLRLIRALARRERTRLHPKYEEFAQNELLVVAQAPSTHSEDRLRAQHALMDLALSRSDWLDARKWLAVSEGQLGENSAERSPKAHLAHSTLATRFAIELESPSDVIDRHRSVLESAIDDTLETIRMRPPRRGGSGYLRYVYLRSAISELIRCFLILDPEEGAERALKTLLSVQDLGTIFRELGGMATTLEDVRRTLLFDDERALLVYLPAIARTHLFLVEAQSVRHFPLASQDQVELAASKLVRSLESPTVPELRARQDRLRSELGKLLLPPVVQETLIELPRVTIVANAFLTTIPFESLPLENSELGLELALDHLFSMSLGVLLTERTLEPKPPAKGDVIILAGAAPGAKIATTGRKVATIQPEWVESIAAAYPENEAIALVEKKATLAALSTRVSSCKVLQFFTHGYYDSERERPACLVLTPAKGNETGLVGADEIEGLADNCEALDTPEIVLLTTCGSGLGPARVGDGGASSLSGAFFTASSRTRCVLLSSFSLEVEATRRFSKSFHVALRAGKSPAEAARLARVSLASDERFADPFYYALIRVIGLGHQPVFR